MASIVLGLGSSHSPQLSIPAAQWDVLRKKDETDNRIDYQALLGKAKKGIEDEITPELMQQRYDACQRAIAELGTVLRRVKPDVIVMLGDDQKEQFLDDNMPMFCVYRGEKLPVVKRQPRGNNTWMSAEVHDIDEAEKSYDASPSLAGHIIDTFVREDFDIATSLRLKPEIGIGHAFSFLYRRLLPEGEVPMVPLMVNTYYPPNQPTPKRCYTLGQVLREAIESWDSDARVAVMASGGLSHVILDEELDRVTVKAMQDRDKETLCSLPGEKLKLGTSEIRNWIAVAGAMEPLKMNLIDYVPTYRSPASTGCGMGFAYWQ